MIQIDEWKKDVEMIQRRWIESGEQMALHPNHEYALRRDIQRLILIATSLDQYIRETIGGYKKASAELDLAKKSITSGLLRPSTGRCTCGRIRRDPYCPIHRSQEPQAE